MSGQMGDQGGGEGNLTCSPSILYVGGNTTCSVGLSAGATGQVTYSLDGQYSTVAAPNSLGLTDALINLASASAGSHTIAFSYPGDEVNPPSSGNTTVTVVAAGSNLPGASGVYQFGITYATNGNVSGYFDSVNGLWSQIQYDGLNRLISAQVSPAFASIGSTNSCWAYDSFGNRTSQILSNQTISGDGTYCSPQSPSTATWMGHNSVYTASNWIDHNVDPVAQTNLGSPVQYDSSGTGNVVADGLDGVTPHGYLYDAEGRICAVQLPPAIPGLPNQMIQYLYDAEGSRIGKGTITQWSCNTDTNNFSLTNEYVLGQAGEQVTELDGDGNWLHTNAYAGGQLIATYDSLGLHYQLADWQGTRRMQVSPSGAMEETCQSLPFGDQLDCIQTNTATADDATEHHFTGKERDAESGNDYFGARYYDSAMGPWMSPDWSAKEEPVPYAKLDNPQTLNLYQYVQNNPLAGVDADGHDGPPGVMEEVDEFVKGIWEEGVSKGWLPAVEGGGIAISPVAVATGGGLVIGGAMLFPKDLSNSDLPVDANGKPIVPKDSLAPAPLAPRPQDSQAPSTNGYRPHDKDPSPSKKDKHEKVRPGTSPPPNYVPDRDHKQPKDDKEKDREPPPYHRKDRDPRP
jgi:RHS repeat-associated protein